MAVLKRAEWSETQLEQIMGCAGRDLLNNTITLAFVGLSAHIFAPFPIFYFLFFSLNIHTPFFFLWPSLVKMCLADTDVFSTLSRLNA